METGSRQDGQPGATNSLEQTATADRGSRVIQVGRDLQVELRIEYKRPIPQDDVDSDQFPVAFATPEGYTDARTKLLSPSRSVVVLSGRPGTGRQTAALQLLTECPGSMAIQELDPDWSTPQAELLPRQPGGRYWLDLTYEENEPTERFGRQLITHAGNLAQVQAFLVITVSPERWRLCARATEVLTTNLEPPDAGRVLRVHLEYRDRVGTRTGWLDRSPLAGYVDELKEQGRLPQDMVNLATFLMTVEDIDAEFDRVRQWMQRWETVLAELFEDSSEKSASMQEAELQERSLLLACAVLDGCPAGTIWRSADRLLKVIGAELSGRQLLTGPELTVLTKRIDADFRNDTISLVSKRPGVDAAVLDRVWTQRPKLREHLLPWLQEITSDQGAAVRHVDRVAGVLTQLAVRHRSLEVLDVIETWLSEGASQRRLATAVLEDLSVSPDIGSPVRQRLRKWADAKKPPKPPGVLMAIAEVCGGKLGESFLPVALLRLRLLAHRDDLPQVQVAVAAAVRRLVYHDKLRLRVIKQAVEWLGDSTAHRAGTVALLGLLNPDGESATAGLLLADAACHELLRTGWTRLLENDESRPAAQETASRWISGADDGTLDRNAVVEVLAPLARNTLYQYGIGAAILASDSPTRTHLWNEAFKSSLEPQRDATDTAQRPEPTHE